ncbi:MAG: hypothetical protein GY951_15705 [Psychromonas sp.]|nr:hypothetical protein [Psychromonas sp.]
MKSAIKTIMKKYNFSLEQAVWTAHKLNPTKSIQIAKAELSLLEDQMLGKL